MIWKIKRFMIRRKYKKTSCYCIGDMNLNKINLCLSYEEIEKDIKEEKYELTCDRYLIDDIKCEIYLGNIKNTKEDIKHYLWKKHYSNCKQFQKMFWEEYVYQYEINYNLQNNYKEYIQNIKKLNKIKKYLDKHPEFHGITGEGLQNIGHRLGTIDVDFSWRAWGHFMSAYMNSKIKKRKYHYMSFYM